jgi:autoinducer 2-degrading protein
MLIVHVHINVKQNKIQEFIEATKENVKNSLKEEGIANFGLLQKMDDPTHFLLNEVYRSDMAQGKHKETAHYKIWREKVENMMAGPRQSEKFINLFPE